MRIDRRQSQLSYRRRRSGCFSLPIFLGLLVGIAGMAALSWNWIGQRFGVSGSASSSTAASVNAARAAFNSGDLDTAVALARQLYDEQPDNLDALVALARALIYRSYTDYNRAVDRQSALELTTAALEGLPDSPDLLAVHAYALQANGRPVEAAEVAARALKADPAHGLARAALALAYGGVGSFEIALRESQQAVQSPEWALDALRALAISYGDLGAYDRAIETIERAIEHNRRLIPLHFERALYSLQIGDSDAATVAYFQVLTYDPLNVKARLRLCELSSLMRERGAALRYCQEVIDLAPGWADGWYHLGREYFLQGNYAAARDNLHRCSSLQVMQNIPVPERRFECWYLQGQAAEILGDCDSLLATYNEFRAMAADAAVQQTWTYPPEGPPDCSVTPMAAPTPAP